MSLKKSLLLFTLFQLTNYSQLCSYTIMIDPSGDAKHTGRVIQDTFERGITLQCAEQLKKELNKVLPDVRVVLARVPGETIQPLQNASFANRLQVDLYLSIHFYPEPDIPSHLSVFHYLTSATDLWHQFMPLSFYHISQSHLIHIHQTIDIGKKYLKILQDPSKNPFFVMQGLFGIPFQPLVGVKAPALALEAGLAKKDDWKHLIQPLILCLQEIVS